MRIILTFCCDSVSRKTNFECCWWILISTYSYLVFMCTRLNFCWDVLQLCEVMHFRIEFVLNFRRCLLFAFDRGLILELDRMRPAYIAWVIHMRCKGNSYENVSIKISTWYQSWKVLPDDWQKKIWVCGTIFANVVHRNLKSAGTP